MTPTVPEFKAFKRFADISQYLEAIDKVPHAPPGGKMRKTGNFGKRENGGKTGKIAKIRPPADSQDRNHYSCLVSL